MKLRSLLISLAILFAGNTFCQKEPTLAINLLANDNIADVNVANQKEFINSIGNITNYCKNNFDKFPENQKTGILVIVHKEGKPTFKCYSSPKLDEETQQTILKDLSKIEIENTKLADFPFFISVNGNISDFEDFEDPASLKYSEYIKADLQTKLKLNKEYAINEVLPVLSAYQVIVDNQFDGVKTFGTLVKKTDFSQPQDIDVLTSRNKNYWKATMEMSVGNQLIPITKVFMLVSQGELDYARKYIEIISIFSDPKSISSQYLDEMASRIDLFNEELDKQIEIGIEQHDKGNYLDAIKIYDNILAAYPSSSWALYEKYYSENAYKVSQNEISPNDRTDWDKTKVEIYKHNPLYSMDVRANNRKEAYLLFRRQEMSSLFRKEDNILADVYQYAEIATDLGVYDFAAQLFWFTATFDKNNHQNSLNNYLYCLDKLGEKELKAIFKGNFSKVFKSIEAAKEKEMKNSSIYKSMKD